MLAIIYAPTAKRKSNFPIRAIHFIYWPFSLCTQLKLLIGAARLPARRLLSEVPVDTLHFLVNHESEMEIT